MTSPGWYPDPHDPRLVRWFDGEQWTGHAAPALPPKKKLSGGVLAIVVVAVVVLGVVAAGVLAAVAVPVFLAQRERAELSIVSSYTCDDVERFAVDAYGSGGDINLVSLDSILLDDARPIAGLPDEGDDDVFVMSCTGLAVYDDGVKMGAVADLYVDHAGTPLVDLYDQ